MINNNALKQLKQNMNEDGLIENCQTVVEFFQLATPSDYDTFISKTSENFFNDIRTHAFVLKQNQDGYIAELKKNSKAFDNFVNDMAKSADIILTDFRL